MTSKHDMDELLAAKLDLLTPGRRRYVEWMADPYDHVPATQQLLADELGVSRVTLFNWGNRSDVREALVAVTMDSIALVIPKLVSTGLKHALAGKYSYWSDMLRLAGLLNEDKKEHTVTLTLSDPDLSD